MIRPSLAASNSSRRKILQRGFFHSWLAVCLLLVHSGCSAEPAPTVEPTMTASLPGASRAAAIEEQVEQFCGACHPIPAADEFPREAWTHEVQQGFDLYFQSPRSDLQVPLFSDVLQHFQSRAPEALPSPLPSQGVEDGGLRFHKGEGVLTEKSPAVSYLNWTPVGDQGHMLLVTDMRSGDVLEVDPRSPELRSRVLAELDNPAHIEPCDLTGDGRRGFVVADLGTYRPADHNRGRVVWLQPKGATSDYHPVVLADSLARVADVQASDFDLDGDEDLMVAEFGWRQTGRILYLENAGSDRDVPRFQIHEVDSRHGAIHVPIVDLNRDGRMDFVSLVSQEHESVEVFSNEGPGQFRSEPIFRANTPTFGSSGIRLADLDGDGDIDVLYTNGDMFDDFFLRTSHAIHWLENCGTEGWQHHELAKMPGVHRALEADLDGDGDMDIVACALIPETVRDRNSEIQLDSLIWLEQRSRGEFVRYVLEMDECRHAALEVGDFDADGDVDLAVGNFLTREKEAEPRPSLTIWRNTLRDSGQKQ
jgi:hypothetical protein